MVFTRKRTRQNPSQEKRLSDRVSDLAKHGRMVYVHGLRSIESRRRRRAVLRQSQLLVLRLQQEELWEVNGKQQEEDAAQERARSYSVFATQYAQAAHIGAGSYAKEAYTSIFSLSHVDKKVIQRDENIRFQRRGRFLEIFFS
jgi:hypothetical protein